MPPRKRNLDARSAELPGGTAVSSGPSIAKKVKFGADDPVDAEELEYPNSSKKRNAVQTEGYDSDSSDEDVSGNAGPAAAAGDDDDMFATTAPEPAKVEEKTGPRDGLITKSSSKGKEFLDLEDIEGQETGRTTGEHSGTDSEEEEDFEEGDELANADEAPRSRRSKGGMGYVMSSFNMKEEMKEGRFTADGDYLANEADEFAMHDKWLDGVSKKKDLKSARLAKARHDARIAEQERRDQQALARVDALKAIAESALVRRHETVLAALARHGKAKKAGDADAPRRIADLTNYASILFDVHGETDIYEQTNDDVIRTLRLEGEVPRGWEPDRQDDNDGADGMDVDGSANGSRGAGLIARPATSAPTTVAPAATGPDDAPRFFYRWSVTSGVPDEQRAHIHGPYTRKQMSDWISGGFFGGPQAERIDVRLEREQSNDAWRSWSAM